MSRNLDDERPRRNLQIPDVGGIDINRLGAIYGAKGSQNPDYFKYSQNGRDIMGKMFFYTGVTWLGGFGAGSVYGALDGWRNAANPSLRIKINSVMNAVTKHGSKAGNVLATITFIHVTSLWAVDKLKLDAQLNQEAVTPALSGFVTGFLYIFPRGVRAASLAGAIGSLASCAIWYGGSYLLDNGYRRRAHRRG